MLRTIVIILLSAAIIFGGVMGYRNLSKKPEDSLPKPPPVVKSVYAEEVQNGPIPLSIVSSGQLVATRRVTLTSEVTGVLVSSRFREGVRYNRGQVIFTIDNNEMDASVVSLRSNFYSSLLMIMPDLKLDYPDVWPKWDAYLKSVDINNNLPPLPEFTTDRERNFVTANGVVTAYQNCKNIEIRSGKFSIQAPFNGVITQANVQEGGLVAQGQPLGEISSLGDYELELPINISYLRYIETGQDIELTLIEGEGTYSGKVARINPRADVNSQSIIVYVRVLSNELREGMYMEAALDAGTVGNAFELDRKLINNEGEVYIVRNDTLLAKHKVEPVYFKKETAIVRGLEDGMSVVSRPLPAAYPGMKVRIIDTSGEKDNTAEL